MRKKLQNFMFELSYFFELFISFVVCIAVVIFGIRLAIELFDIVFLATGSDSLVHILDSAITLAIGAELIKMLCKHTPEMVIEVLAFALARQLIIGHSDAWKSLIMVVSIAILFGVRRFLLKRQDLVETPDGLVGADDK